MQQTAPQETALPFAQSIQSASQTLIKGYPGFFTHSDPMETAYNTRRLTQNGQVVGVAALTAIDQEYKSEYVLDVVIPMLANDDLSIPENEGSQVRNILYRKAELYLSNDKNHFSDVSLGIKEPESWDRLGHTSERIAALEKFQRGLLERATPTPNQMRK